MQDGLHSNGDMKESEWGKEHDQPDAPLSKRSIHSERTQQSERKRDNHRCKDYAGGDVRRPKPCDRYCRKGHYRER